MDEILHDALGMNDANNTSLPKGVTDKLYRYISEYYPQIELRKIDSIRNLRVETEKGAIAHLLVDGKWKVKAQNFIEINPNSTISEKLGMKMYVDTPHLGYGLVFDVQGLDKKALADIEKSPLLDPDNLLISLGFDKEDIMSNPSLKKKYEALQSIQSKDDMYGNSPYFTYGFKKLGFSYDFYMHLLEYQNPEPLMRMLNKDRVADSFNVAINSSTMTMNSLSYASFQGRKNSVVQHYHHINKDHRFSLIRQIEKPHFEKFLKMLGTSVNRDLEIHMRLPNQMYVRKSDFSLKPLHDLPADKKDGLLAKYHIDTRAATTYNEFDNILSRIAEIQLPMADQQRQWHINVQDAKTVYPNFFSIGKNNTHPLLSGSERILPAQMALGHEVIESLSNN